MYQDYHVTRGGLDIDLIFTDVDIYFQYLRMLKMMWISADADVRTVC